MESIQEMESMLARFHGTFSRRFTLPSAIDADRLNADYKHGGMALS